MKQINHSITLNLIKSQGPLSRTEIARISGLGMATVSDLTGELLESGVIEEVGEAASIGGRPSILLKLNSKARIVVGVKLIESGLTVALVDLAADVLHHRFVPARGLHDPQAAIGAIIQAVEATLGESGIPRAKVLGIGLGLAGVIDSDQGVCHYSSILGWRDVELARPLEEQFKLPVCIENDVNALTLAEQWFGRGHGLDHFLVVTIGRGIGLGIVVNRQLCAGAFGGAGEFGHITMQENGPLCDCGKRGCLQALAGDRAIVRMAHDDVEAGRYSVLSQDSKVKGRLTVARIAEAAQQGDPLALDTLARAGHALGLGLSYVVNLFNPQLIVLSGEGLRAGQALVKAAQETMRKHIFQGLDKGLQIVVTRLGDEAWARGAACVVLSELYKHPIQKDERVRLRVKVA